MNAMMRINVRVTSTSAARQIRQLTREMRAFTAATAAGNTAGMMFGGTMLSRGIRNMEKYGKNLQWVGRQIEFNFTLPLALAGGMATKFAFEAEASFIRLEKVYQDAPDGIYTLQEELDLLRQGFRHLSDEFGVHLEEVNEIGAAWAQAGASGVALAKATRMTLEAMILGDIDATKATEALIAIQGQYELSSKDLQQALADVNKISNITTAGFEDLIEALQRGGGIARQAGVTIREFAAMTASLVPAAGNARRAGTALRTIISRLMAPTTAATDMFRELGLEVDESEWHSMNFTERLHELKEGLNGVTASQRNMALSVIGSRWQVARLAVLMSDLNNEQGRYNDALKGTEDQMKSMETYYDELHIFLTSTPQGFKILTNQIRNLGIDIIQQLLPALLGVMTHLRDLFKRFTELNPRVQQIIVSLALLLMVMGPITRLTGAAILVVSQLAKIFVIAAKGARFFSRMMMVMLGGKAATASLAGLKKVGVALLFLRTRFLALVRLLFTLKFWQGLAARAIAAGAAIISFFKGAGFLGALAKIGSAIFAALTGPWGIAIGVIVFLIAGFWDKIQDFINRINEKWGSIPDAVGRAMHAVVRIVRSALEAVSRMFRSLFGMGTPEAPPTPAAGTSPGGVQMARGGRVPGQGEGDTVPALLTPGEFVMRKDAVNKYGVAAFESMNALKFQSGGRVPGALANFLAATEGARTAMREAEMAEKRSLVLEFAPGAGDEFDAIVAAIEQYTRRGEQLTQQIARQEQVVASWQRRLDSANLTLEAATDRLDVLRDRADAVGDALSSAQTELDNLMNTPIEGMQEYSDALFQNEMQQKRLRLEMLKMEEAGDSIDDVKDRLAALSGEIEMLRGRREDLRLAGAGSEILGTFDTEIKALEQQRDALMAGGGGAGQSGIAELQKQLEDLQKQAEMMELEESIKFDPMRRKIDQVTNSMQEMPFDQLLAKIIAQQQEVARLTQRHDQANAAVDRQQGVVDRLTAARDRVRQSYDSEKASLDALNDTYSMVESQIRQMESALDGFVSTANSAKAAAEAAAASGSDLSKTAEDFRAAAGDFEIPGGTGDIGMEEGDLQKLIDEWGETISEEMGDFSIFGPFMENLKHWWSNVVNFFKDLGVIDLIKDIFSGIGDWVGDQLEGWRGSFDPFVQAWNDIGDVLSAWNERIREAFGGDTADGIRAIGRVFQWVGSMLFDSLNLVIGIVTGVFALIWPTVRHVVEQFGNAVIEIFAAIVKIVGGFINLFSAENWREALSALLQIFRGIWDAIYGLIRGTVGLIAGQIMGFVEGVADFFKWLGSVLVGNSIIPDMINAIIKWFMFLTAPIRAVWKAIWAAIKWVWENGIKPIWAGMKIFWNKVLKPAIQNIGKIFSSVFRAVGKIVKWIWENVIKRAWQGIQFYWNRVLKPAIRSIGRIFNSVFRTVGNIVRNIWNNVIKPIWNALKWYWENQLKPAIQNISRIFSSVFRGVGSTLSRIWNNVIRPVFNAFKRGIEALPKAFRTARDGIGRIWRGIKSLVGKPIKWLADNVLNRLIRGFNVVARKVPGLATLSTINIPQFHEGGVVGPGAGKNRNLARHPLKSDESVAVLRHGERVLTEEERQWYEQNDPNAIRHVGGAFDWIPDAANAVGRAVGDAGRSILNTIRSVIADVARPIVNRAMDAVGNLPVGGWLGRVLKGSARNMGNAVLDWLDNSDDIAKKMTPDFMSDIVQVGRKIKGMGYNVAEHPAFGGVAPVHSPNSYHYKGQAIDVNYYPRSSENAKLDRLHGWIKKNVDPSKIAELIWRAPGHWSHLHLAMHGAASGYYGPGAGSPSVGDVANPGAGTGGLVMDSGGVFTRPTTGMFAMAQSSMARPEVVSPVPLLRKVIRSELRSADAGKTELNFYGDLEFPNIKDGSDAEEFIANIKSLSRAN